MLSEKTIVWPGKVTAIPLGRPKCGFNEEFCPSTGFWICSIFYISFKEKSDRILYYKTD